MNICRPRAFLYKKRTGKIPVGLRIFSIISCLTLRSHSSDIRQIIVKRSGVAVRNASVEVFLYNSVLDPVFFVVAVDIEAVADFVHLSVHLGLERRF